MVLLRRMVEKRRIPFLIFVYEDLCDKFEWMDEGGEVMEAEVIEDVLV